MTKRIFISYRRDDSAGHAGRVFDRLRTDFGQDVLFMDVDAIPLGANFVRVLREEVAKCDVLLAIMGPGWLGAKDEAGVRRLDNPTDFVRIEIAAALGRDIPVIPILLEGTRMPNAGVLPADLAELSERNGLDVRHASFHADMDKLVRGLKGAPNKSSVAMAATKRVGLPPAVVIFSSSAITIPTISEIISARGQWLKDFKVDQLASTTPANFRHLFIVADRTDKADCTAGAIVIGQQWTITTRPFWTVVHGYSDSQGYTCLHNDRLAYLGATWHPEYAELSAAVFKKLGGKPLGRFITHP